MLNKNSILKYRFDISIKEEICFTGTIINFGLTSSSEKMERGCAIQISCQKSEMCIPRYIFFQKKIATDQI